MENEKRAQDTVQEEEKIDLSVLIDDLMKGLVRFWWIFLVIISLCATVSFFYARWTYKPVYRAYSTFTVRTVDAFGSTTERYNQTVARQLGEVFPYLLTSELLQKKVAQDIGTSSVPGTISAKAQEDTSLITLSVEADNGQLAYDILQSVLRNYPSLSQYVIGNIALGPMDESGIPASPSNSVNFRRKARNGAVIGAALCLAFLLFYAMTRKTVRSEEDLRKVFHIPCLGSVPEARIKKRSKEQKGGLTITVQGIPYMFVESVRAVRNRLEREAAQDGAKTIIVTSAVPHEGKTTVAVNLALSLAHKKRRTILIDADLRNPSVAEALGMEKPEAGFSDVLRGTVDAADALVPYPEMKHLYVIPGGKAIADPASLLGREEFGKAIRFLRDTADYVILDTPPSAVLSDAAQAARHADGGVFVVMQDYARTDILQEGMEMLHGTGVKMLGCVLNGAHAGFTGSGYGYGRYGYGKYGGYGKKYGYGYVYGADHEKKKAESEKTPEQ